MHEILHPKLDPRRRRFKSQIPWVKLAGLACLGNTNLEHQFQYTWYPSPPDRTVEDSS